MSTITTELKPVPAQFVALKSSIDPGFGPENISPVIGPLFGQLANDLETAGISSGPQSLAMYEAIESGDGKGARIYAAFPIDPTTSAVSGLNITEIPGVDLAATTVHYGSKETIGESWEGLQAWIEENGYELAGVCREL